MRELVAETRLDVAHLVAPLFVKEGITQAQPIHSLPGVVQHSLDSLEREVDELMALGIRGVILFGVPEKKDDIGSEHSTQMASCKLHFGGWPRAQAMNSL